MNPVDDLITVAIEKQMVLVAAAKAHQDAIKAHEEGYASAIDDLRLVSSVLKTLKGEDGQREPDPERESAQIPIHAGMAVMDLGPVASERPVANPFADQPDRLPSLLWTVMREGHPWHVSKAMIPALKSQGHKWSEASIYKVFRQHPTVFALGEGGWYVTKAYRAMTPDDDA